MRFTSLASVVAATWRSPAVPKPDPATIWAPKLAPLPAASTCATATSVIWYAFMHAKSPGWRGGTTVAWPFARPVFDLGEVFSFNVHHAMEVDDPLETFRIELEDVT